MLLSVRLHNLQLTHQLKPQKRLYTLGLRKRQLLVIKDDVIRDYLCFKGITRLIQIIYTCPLDATASLKPVAPKKKRYSVINLNQQHIGAVRLSSCRSFLCFKSGHELQQRHRNREALLCLADDVFFFDTTSDSGAEPGANFYVCEAENSSEEGSKLCSPNCIFQFLSITVQLKL